MHRNYQHLWCRNMHNDIAGIILSLAHHKICIDRYDVGISDLNYFVDALSLSLFICLFCKQQKLAMSLQIKVEKFSDRSILSHFVNLNLDQGKKCCVLKLINYSNKLRGLLRITRHDVYITHSRPPPNWLSSFENGPYFIHVLICTETVFLPMEFE